jgi:hypothetical protein
MERSTTIFEKVGALIPGYRGYAERDGRRQCDKILRESVVRAISACEAAVQNRIATELKNRQKEILIGLEETRKKLNTLSTNVKYAAYGESSFFSNSQIKEAELEIIFMKDINLMEKAETLRSNVSKMSKEDIDATITDIEGLLEKRAEFIREHK